MEYVNETDNNLQTEVPPFTHAEISQMLIRVIALENLVITLLTAASDRQLDLACEMAIYIIPRQGITPHPLTIHASTHIIQLIERANYFKSIQHNNFNDENSTLT